MATSIKDLPETERNKLIVTCSNNLTKYLYDSVDYKANLRMLELLLKHTKIKELNEEISGIELM